MQSAIWLIIAVVLAVIEASTVQLVCIWFALGAVLALITSVFTENILVQVLVFIFSSVIMLAFTRKIVNRLTGSKSEATNADSLIGKTFTISEEVNNDAGTGTLKARGTVWSVVNVEEAVIPSGTKVIIEKIEGVKLFVKKVV
ncbi:MAG: NfeD family protein [Clostridia bacterium]|nr:NfeD family protein [Clostridia bacterium]